MTYKQILLGFLLLTIGLGQSLIAQESDALCGVWLTAKKNAKIEIKKVADGTFEGTVIWGVPAPGEDTLDTKNPDPSLRSRPRLGLTILRGFKYDEDNEWRGGKIYDPQDGNDYKCILTLEKENVLNVRGYIGISLFGRSEKWTRVISTEKN
ncbi:MAG: DUF2147 domain-containing protein [Chloroherpetonaceae bacterium]|nr:DUF2147 domain-containing protein [Chloroherpetonaceae bacterium]